MFKINPDDELKMKRKKTSWIRAKYFKKNRKKNHQSPISKLRNPLTCKK